MPSFVIEIIVKGKDAASGPLGKVGGSLASLGKIALVGGAAVGTAVAGIGAGLAKLAADAAPMEGIQNAFRGIAEASGSSMEEMLGALQRGSLGMISQRELMASYNEAAQLVGTTFANQLPDAMQFLSKTAAATGQDMGFMLDSLTKGVGRLSPMILDNLGIQVSLSEATANAAEQFGVQAEDLTKAQTQAGLMNVVLEKLKKNTEAMPDVTTNASTRMAKFSAQMRDAKDAAGLALVPALGELVSAASFLFTIIFPKLLAVIERLAPTLQRAAAGVVGAVELLGDILPELGGFFQAVVEDGDFLNDFLFRLPANIQPVVQGFGQVIAVVSEFVRNHSAALIGAIKAIGLVFAKAGIIRTLVMVGKVLLSLASPITLIVALVGLLGAAWAENWGGIREKTAAAWEVIRPIVEQLKTALAGVASLLTGSVLPAFQTVVGWVQANLPGILATIQNVFGAIVGIVSPVLEAVVASIQERLGIVVGWVQANWPLIQETFATVMAFVQGVIETGLAAIQQFWTAHGEMILSGIVGVWETIQSAINVALTFILELVTATMQAINGDWTAAWETVKAATAVAWDAIKVLVNDALGVLRTIIEFALGRAQSLVSAAWEAIKGETAAAWEGIKGLVSAGLEAMVGLITGAAGKMVGAGKAIVDKIKEGIAAAWGDLTSWFNDRLSDLTDLLPFSEPRRRSPFSNLDRAGMAIGDNILEGLRRSLPRLEAELQGMGMGQGGGTVQNFGRNREYNYNYHVTDDRAMARLMDRERREQREELGELM